MEKKSDNLTNKHALSSETIGKVVGGGEPFT